MQIDLVKYYLNFNNFIKKLDEVENTNIPKGYKLIKKYATEHSEKDDSDKNTKL